MQRRLVLLKAQTEYRNDSTKIKYDPTNPNHRWGDSKKVKSLNSLEARMQLLVWLAHGAKAFYDANCTLPPIPKSLSDFADEVQLENDVVGSFVREACVIDPAFKLSEVAEYNRYQSGVDHRYLYLAEQLAADFEEHTGQQFSTVHMQKLMKNYGIAKRRVRKGCSIKARPFFVGIKEVVMDDVVEGGGDDNELVDGMTF